MKGILVIFRSELKNHYLPTPLLTGREGPGMSTVKFYLTPSPSLSNTEENSTETSKTENL